MSTQNTNNGTSGIDERVVTLVNLALDTATPETRELILTMLIDEPEIDVNEYGFAMDVLIDAGEYVCAVILFAAGIALKNSNDETIADVVARAAETIQREGIDVDYADAVDFRREIAIKKGVDAGRVAVLRDGANRENGAPDFRNGQPEGMPDAEYINQLEDALTHLASQIHELAHDECSR